MSFETNMPRGPETHKNEAERIELERRRALYSKPLGETVLGRILKENAAPRFGSIDREVEHLRDPQNTDFYNKAEGFIDMFAEEPSQAEAMGQFANNGVEKLADGTIILKSEGVGHNVNQQGVPVE